MMKYGGNVPHMYLDTKGYVTVGVDHLLKDVEAAKKVPFTVRDTVVKATIQQIEGEFKSIKAMPWGKKYEATYYKPFTTLVISDAVREA